MSLDRAVHKRSPVEDCLPKEQALGLLCWTARAGTWLTRPQELELCCCYSNAALEKPPEPCHLYAGRGGVWCSRKIKEEKGEILERSKSEPRAYTLCPQNRAKVKIKQ